MLSCRQWPGGVAVESQLRTLGAIPGAGHYPNGPRAGIVAVEGPFAHCDVWVTAARTWDDVDFRLIGRVGNSWIELDVKMLDDVEHARRDANGTSGLLFSSRGRVCDEFSVEAYHTAVAHENGSFSMVCWGEDGAALGDRGGRQIVAPFAQPHQQWRASFLLDAAGPVVLQGPHPLGGRLFLTHLTITNNDPVQRRLELVTPAGVIFQRWISFNESAIVEHWTYPDRYPLGDGLNLNLVAITGGSNFAVNATGYLE